MMHAWFAGPRQTRCLGSLILLAPVVLLAGCGASVESASIESAAGARLVCRGDVHDVGDTHENLVEHTFEIVNASAAPVQISQIAKSCGCADVDVADASLEPGETTTVTMKLEINPSKPGSITRFREELAIILADDKKPTLRLWLQGRYIPVAYKLTNRVNMTTSGRVGEQFEGEFDVFVNHELGVDVSAIETEGAFPFDAEMVLSESVPGTPYQKRTIKLSGVIRDGTELPAYGRVAVRTNHEKLAELDAQIVLLPPVGQEVHFTPSVLAFGVVDSVAEPITKPLFIRFADAEQQTLESVDTDIDDLEVRVRDRDLKPGHILLDCTLHRDVAQSGPIRGDVLVVVRSNAGLQEVRVPVSGFIRPLDSDGQ